MFIVLNISSFPPHPIVLQLRWGSCLFPRYKVLRSLGLQPPTQEERRMLVSVLTDILGRPGWGSNSYIEGKLALVFCIFWIIGCNAKGGASEWLHPVHHSNEELFWKPVQSVTDQSLKYGLVCNKGKIKISDYKKEL